MQLKTSIDENQTSEILTRSKSISIRQAIRGRVKRLYIPANTSVQINQRDSIK